MKILARKLLDIPPSELAGWITGSFILVFDDGEIETNTKETILSSFFWDYHRKYKELSLLKDHHFTTHLKGKRLKNRTHLSLVSSITKEWYRVFENSYTNNDKLDMLHIAYSSTNNYYNYIASKLNKYVTSVDITDLISIIDNSKIKDLRENAIYSQQGVKDLHKEIINTIVTDEEISKNPIARLLQSGLVKDLQLVQCIGPFGYPKDIDDYIFKRPIKRGYVEGLRSLYDSLTESRTAATSLYLSKSHLKKVEYFSRKAQLVGMNISKIHRGDCGSTNYVPWEVINKKELIALEGTYYLDTDNVLKTVSKNDDHLLGSIILTRHISGCNHPGNGEYCEVCFGKIARNIIDGTITGQQTGVTMASQNTQKVLSTKHVISSGIAAKIVLRDNQSRYFRVSPDGMGYMLNPTLNKNGLKITIEHSSMLNLTSILHVKDISKISPSRVTDISTVRITYQAKGRNETITEDVNMEFQARRCHATREFLEYMKNESKWEINARGHYEISLDEWDDSLVMFKTIEKQFSTVDFSKGITEILESKAELADIRNNTTPIEFAKDFSSYISTEMNIPISVLSAISYSYSIVNRDTPDFSLPKPHTRKGIGVLKEIMPYRSLGAAMAYQEQNELLMNPDTYLLTNRPDHVFDYMLLPQEVVKHKK